MACCPDSDSVTETPNCAPRDGTPAVRRVVCVHVRKDASVASNTYAAPAPSTPLTNLETAPTMMRLPDAVMATEAPNRSPAKASAAVRRATSVHTPVPTVPVRTNTYAAPRRVAFPQAPTTATSAVPDPEAMATSYPNVSPAAPSLLTSRCVCTHDADVFRLPLREASSRLNAYTTPCPTAAPTRAPHAPTSAIVPSELMLSDIPNVSFAAPSEARSSAVCDHGFSPGGRANTYAEPCSTLLPTVLP